MKLRSLKKQNDGSLSYFFVFVFLATVLLTVFAIAIPLLININTEFYNAGQDIIDQANSDLVIGDSEVAEAVSDVLTDASDSTADQITILAGLFQYSWLIIISVICLVIYIIARSTVEVNVRSGLV